MAVILPLVRKQGRNRRMGSSDALPGTLATRQRQTLTGTAGQKQFTVAGGYSLLGGVALLDVYINGVYITEYAATDGTTFTLTDGLDSANDEVVVVPGVVNVIGASSGGGGGGGGGGTDPNYSSVIFLSHFDGASGAESATDQKGQTITFGASASLSTSVKQFGSASLRLPGDSNSYVQMASNDVWNFAANDLTIEAFVRWSGDAAGGIICRRNGVAEGWAIQIESDGSLKLRAKINGTWSDSQLASTASAVPAGAFAHIALTRKGNTWTFWVNGNSVGSTTITGLLDDQVKPIRIGQSTSINYNESPLIGYIDDLRVTNGVCRYTASFTPPTSAFPDQ